MESQIRKLTRMIIESPLGNLPENTRDNSNKDAKVVTLRSGKELSERGLDYTPRTTFHRSQAEAYCGYHRRRLVHWKSRDIMRTVEKFKNIFVLPLSVEYIIAKLLSCISSVSVSASRVFDLCYLRPSNR
ncbi:hypothetical protein M9H77_13095 [Catharanthus roseus]|uniref:Uncharacterized protein n=1 Tax=Catharanthus roseus TaxID=4058 RepID=A0ACC0BJE5_CATRO|nr:hypothetical protein M9H77_13095 [Catharanthus roseus]